MSSLKEIIDSTQKETYEIVIKELSGKDFGEWKKDFIVEYHNKKEYK